MKPFCRLILTRFAIAIVTIFCVATVTFFLMKSIPGDPFQDEKGVPEECLKHLRQYWGLEDPLSVQYLRFVKSIFCFDFGPSLKYPAVTVNDIIHQGFPISALLGLEALLIAIPFGMLLGIISAMNHRKFKDSLFRFISVLGVSTPSFVIATLLQFVFAFYLSLFPVARFGTFWHTVLPSVTLAIGPMAMISRLLRASMLDVFNQQYVFTAYAKGLSSGQIIRVHILKNAILPILSYLGPVTTNVLVGSFVVERVFAIPGLGSWFVMGVLNRDYPVIGGLTCFYSMVLITIHSILDLFHVFLDPRVKIDATR